MARGVLQGLLEKYWLMGTVGRWRPGSFGVGVVGAWCAHKN